VLCVPRDPADRTNLSGWVTFAVFLVVVGLIAIVLIAQKIPDAERPTIKHPTATTIVITQTPTP
jgi:heme/copper-type cytochrome/quinol oxidase subunit 2